MHQPLSWWRRPNAARTLSGRRHDRQKLSLLELERRDVPALVVGLTATGNQLVTFDTSTPGTVTAPVAVTGLPTSDSLVGIAYRPLTGVLYGLGKSGLLYTLDATTGAATRVTTNFTAITPNGTNFGFDINPVTDQIRVTSDTGQNFRIDPASGFAIDGDPNTADVQPDTALSPAGSSVTGLAYTNNFAGAATTTLFGIDPTTDQLVRIGGVDENPSPNLGAVTAIGPLGVDTTADIGFDIPANQNVAYATLTVGGASQFYTVNLAAGAATLVGSIGATPTVLRGIAVQSRAVTLFATDGTNLLRLDSATPGTVAGTTALTGLATGETLAAIDLQPATGTLFGVAVNGTAVRLVTINPATGGLTQVGSPFALTTGATVVGVDFDPVANLLRVVTNVGDNLAINPITGAVTTGPTLSATGVVGVAANNNFAGATSTTLFGINATTNELVSIDSTTGTVTTVGPLGVTLTAGAPDEMDIAAGDGTSFAALNVGGTTGLYTIDLTTGKATLIGALGTGTTAISGLTVGPSGRISGSVFVDLDGDGIRVFGESGQAGVTVQLDANNDGIADFTATTDAAGNYVFTDLPDGTYVVRVVAPADFTATGTTSQTVIVTNAAAVAVPAFSLQGVATLSGTFFNDLNRNGIRDPGEPGVSSNISVSLGVGVRMTFDASGNYQFTGVPDGTYTIMPSFTPTPGTSSPFFTFVPASRTVTVQNGASQTGLDFAVQFTGSGSISGTVFNDTNFNGVRDAGETGRAGITMDLDLNNDGTVDMQATTDTTGFYQFTNVPAGTHLVQIVQNFTLPVGTTVSFVPPSRTVTVQSGAAVTGQDFAVQTRTTLTQRVHLFATGAGLGGGPHVKVFNADGTLRFSFFAYDVNFTGGVSVATGDVNGDGIDDVITGAGPGGGPHVKVFSGADGSLLQSFYAYDASFIGGVWVAAGDVNGDGKAEIITGAGPGGGPHVIVRDGQTLAIEQSFFAYVSNFAGGVRVAAGDVNGDGKAEIITGAGPGGGPHVKVFNGQTAAEEGGFFAFNQDYTGGVFVAAGDLNGDGKAEIVVGPGEGNDQDVRVFDGQTFAQLQQFQAFGNLKDEGGSDNPLIFLNGGTRVAVEDLTGDGKAEILASPGSGSQPRVRIFDGTTFDQQTELSAYDDAFSGGVFVG